jgi:hypothetical protein
MCGRLLLTTFLSSTALAGETCRDALLWPFNASSIWNVPLGASATLIPAHIFDPADPRGPGAAAFWNFHSDDDYIFATKASDPLVPWFNQGHWGGPATPAAYCAVTGPLVRQLHFPANVSITTFGNNNGAALLQPDGDTLVLTQPLYVCAAGGPLLSRLDASHGLTSIRGGGANGGHGGSGLSNMGGTVRRGELARGAPPIAHALKLELWAHWWYWAANGNRSECFLWPAVACDGYFNSATDEGAYNGTNPLVRPGALLAIGAADAAALNGTLRSEPARQLLAALAAYGGYLVDDTYWNASSICTEHGVEADFLAAWGWSFTVTANEQAPAARAWYEDLLSLFRALAVVASNGPGAPGGGGAPLAPPPPPFCGGAGGAPAPATPWDAVLHLHSNATRDALNARCLDGSNGGFYFRPAKSAAAATKWKIHFQGGGWCTYHSGCAQRAKSILGSSAHFPPTLSAFWPPEFAGFSGLMSYNDSTAAITGEWNFVWLAYCDGTSQTSDVAEPIHFGNDTFYLRGRALLAAHLAELEAEHGFLSTATEVVVSGTSAGGLSANLHAPTIAAALRVPSARVVAVPDAGFWCACGSFGAPAEPAALRPPRPSRAHPPPPPPLSPPPPHPLPPLPSSLRRGLARVRQRDRAPVDQNLHARFAVLERDADER